MSTPSSKTFHFLASTPNPHFLPVLLEGLDIGYPVLQAQAVRAIAFRDGKAPHVAVVSRWMRLSPEAKQQATQWLVRLDDGLKECLKQGIESQALAAIELVNEAHYFNAISPLIEAHRREETTVSCQAALCIKSLANALYEQLHLIPAADSSTAASEIAEARKLMLQALSAALTDGCALPDPVRIAEAFVILTEPSTTLNRRVFNDANAESAIVDMFLNSTDPGVIRFILECLSNEFPPPQVLRTIEFRSDKTFVQALLTWFRDQSGRPAAGNLKRLTEITWLEKFRQVEELVPEELQKTLVAFTEATGLGEFRKTRILKWLLQNGAPDCRSDAAQLIAKLDSTATQAIVQDGLSSQDEGLQAWATSQLRSQKVPDAIAQLTKRLDSPLASVRDVARQELSGFDIERLLSLFKQLDPLVCLRAGETIQKINPQCVQDLIEELKSPLRQKRIRAASGAVALGMHTQVVPQLLALAGDNDSLVRRTAAEVLGYVGTDESLDVLKSLRDDSSPAVRDAAVQSIAKLEETLVGLVNA